jgi:hypothetical protein
LSNQSPTGTAQQCRKQLVHHGAANAASEDMNHDAPSKIVHKTTSSKETLKHAVQCDSDHIDVNGNQPTV